MIRNDYFNNPDNLPDYYDTMYLDGFEPWQILYAHHQTMNRQIEQRKEPEEYKKTIIVGKSFTLTLKNAQKSSLGLYLTKKLQSWFPSKRIPLQLRVFQQ